MSRGSDQEEGKHKAMMMMKKEDEFNEKILKRREGKGQGVKD